LCPECGQPITDEHAHTRKTELIAEFDSNYERINAITLESSTTEQHLGKLAKEIKELEKNNEQFMDLKLHARMLEQQVTVQGQIFLRAMQDIKKIESETNPFTAMCDELEARYKKLTEQRDELIEKLNTINGEIEILKFWQKGYRDIRLQQIDTTLLELELATNRNAAALGLQNWEIQFATERETKSGATSHVFSILLFPPGQDKPIPWESYSGGEAQRWQLAVTFGLSEVLMSRAGIDPDIEILDEPTGFLSQEGIDDLLECLHARAHELQRRIYLIDHRSLERGSFDGIVTVIKDDAGIHIEGD
jgi:DNA repair exonuclease SbcCD ATPase subunit